jgi:hypothetical protein
MIRKSFLGTHEISNTMDKLIKSFVTASVGTPQTPAPVDIPTEKISYAEAEKIGFVKTAKALGRNAFEATCDLGKCFDSGSIWNLIEENGQKFFIKNIDEAGNIVRKIKASKTSEAESLVEKIKHELRDEIEKQDKRDGSPFDVSGTLGGETEVYDFSIKEDFDEFKKDIGDLGYEVVSANLGVATVQKKRTQEETVAKNEKKEVKAEVQPYSQEEIAALIQNVKEHYNTDISEEQAQELSTVLFQKEEEYEKNKQQFTDFDWDKIVSEYLGVKPVSGSQKTAEEGGELNMRLESAINRLIEKGKDIDTILVYVNSMNRMEGEFAQGEKFNLTKEELIDIIYNELGYEIEGDMVKTAEKQLSEGTQHKADETYLFIMNTQSLYKEYMRIVEQYKDKIVAGTFKGLGFRDLIMDAASTAGFHNIGQSAIYKVQQELVESAKEDVETFTNPIQASLKTAEEKQEAKLNYSNEYGSLSFELVTEFLPVSQINKTIVPEDAFYPIETLEKIALITENKRLQPVYIFQDKRGYYILHNSVSTGAVVKISNISFTKDVNPEEEIDRLKRPFRFAEEKPEEQVFGTPEEATAYINDKRKSNALPPDKVYETKQDPADGKYKLVPKTAAFEEEEPIEEEISEPQQGDYIITPSGNLGSKTYVSVHEGTSKDLSGEFGPDEDIDAIIKADMEKNNYFPNVWYVDDHGGVTPHTIEASSVKKEITAEEDGIDSAAADELYIFAVNDGDLYRQMLQPIYKNLVNKKAQGVYNRDLALKAFMNYMSFAAQKYVREYATEQDKWFQLFPVEVRKESARQALEYFENEMELGNYDNYLHKKYQKKQEPAKETEAPIEEVAPVVEPEAEKVEK